MLQAELWELVCVCGAVDPQIGYVIDLGVLSTTIKQHVLDHLDHKNLNLDVPFMEGKLCSTENLAIAIWEQLQPHIPSEVQLHCVKLYETPSICVEYFGN